MLKVWVGCKLPEDALDLLAKELELIGPMQDPDSSEQH